MHVSIPRQQGLARLQHAATETGINIVTIIQSRHTDLWDRNVGQWTMEDTTALTKFERKMVRKIHRLVKGGE
jgi:hypothetical protein